MNKTEITQAVKSLIEENKLKEALKSLSGYAKGIDGDLENDLLLQTSAFNRNEKDRGRGLLSKEDYTMGISKLNYNLTQIIERLPEEGNDVKISKSNPNAASLSVSREVEVANNTHKILFLAASPEGTTMLNLGKELREIKDQLSASTYRDKFDLESETAVKIRTITKAMQVHKPEIVHFSGHGSGESGLVVENDAGEAEFFPTEGINRLFRLFKKDVKCVVLNACYAAEQAELISQHGIYVIGMNDTVEDKAAIDFATGFYQSLGEGNDYEFAFQIALVNISSNLEDADTPELWYDGKKLDL